MDHDLFPTTDHPLIQDRHGERQQKHGGGGKASR